MTDTCLLPDCWCKDEKLCADVAKFGPPSPCHASNWNPVTAWTIRPFSVSRARELWEGHRPGA